MCNVYRGNDCIKSFVNFNRTHNGSNWFYMKLLTNGQQKSYVNAKICYACKEQFEGKYAKDKIIVKFETIVNIQEGNIEIMYIGYVI